MNPQKVKLAKERAREALAMLDDGQQDLAESAFAEAQLTALEAAVSTPAVEVELATPVADMVTLTREQYQLLEQRQRRLEMELQGAKVKQLCDAALARGVPPAVVNTVMPVLLACQRDAEPTIRLTADAQPVNLFQAVATILEAVPGRLGEITNPDVGTRPVTLSQPITVEQAEELARKRRKELGIKSAIQAEVEL